MTNTKLRINEIFYSIQGESTHAGRPCVFVRLTGCHLRCHYCDTEYSFTEGDFRSIESIVEEVCSHPCDLVEITGGEPLLQLGVHELMRSLCDRGKTVLLETSGACDVSTCDPRVIRILDLKTPASGEVARNDWPNLDDLRADRDEIKFVICNRGDYEWAREIVREHDLSSKVKAILFSPVFEQPGGVEIRGMGALEPCDLAAWLLDDAIPKARMQFQLHKFIWDPQMRGV